jgi:cytochrome c-type biogenesis protein CcmH/NrfG
MLSSCEGGSKSGDSSRIVNAPAFRPPRASCAWYALGLAFEKQNKNDAARNALERAVRLDPANADARLLLASILAGHDAPQAKEQIEILNKDASLSPAKVAAVKNLQQQLIQKP